MSGYKKPAVKKDICLHISFKTRPFKKVSFYQACPKQTVKKSAQNNSVLHGAYSPVNEESLYPFCSGLQQLPVLGSLMKPVISMLSHFSSLALLFVFIL